MSSVFDDLESTLPSGFHDAVLLAIEVDYVSLEGRIRLDVDVDLEARAAPRYRRGELRMSGLLFVTIEPPVTGVRQSTSALRVGAGSGRPSTSAPEPPGVPDDVIRFWIFVTPWNSFVHVACKTLQFAWVEEED